MAKTALSSLKGMRRKKRAHAASRSKRAEGSNNRAVLAAEENGLEDTPLRSVGESRRAERRVRTPEQKSAAALVLRRLIAVPVIKIVRSMKNDKKLRLRYCAAAVLLVAGIIVAAVLTFGNHAAAGAANIPGATSSALQSDAPGETQHSVAGFQAEPSASYVREVLTPSTTPVATTPPEPSITPAPTKKPESTPKPTTKSKPKPTTKPTPKPSKANLTELSKYFLVEDEKYYDDIGYSSNYYDYTEEEVLMLARVITREAGNESYEGMLAVGNVVMNRVFCGYWGKTIESVVTANNQFAYRPSSTPKSRCVDAARDVLKNQHWVVPQNVYFFNSGRTPGEDWGRYKYCMKIGGHCFYTHKLGKRYMGDSIPPALYKRTFKWPQYGCKPESRVKRLQQMLKKLGYETNTDGYFGKTTKEAVIKFQKDKKLKADGVAGPTTIKALIKAYGTDAYRKKYVK